MKKHLFNAIAAVIFWGASQFALASSIQDIQGTWSVIDRICTDGNRAHDRFQLGRDSVEFTISGNQMRAVITIDGVVEIKSGNVILSERQLVTTDKDGGVNSMLYEVGKDNELVLINAKFGKGGSCAEGEALMTVFRKK